MSARERFDKFKWKLVVPDEAFSNYDEMEDFKFLVSLVEAAIGAYLANRTEELGELPDLKERIWQEIEERVDSHA